MNGRDRPTPPNWDEYAWARFCSELDVIEEVAHPLGPDDGALAEVISLAKAPLDLPDDGGDEGGKKPRKPPPRPRRRAAKSAAPKKLRMPTTFAEVKPLRPSGTPTRARGGLYTIDLLQRKVLTASGHEVPGGWAAYVTSEKRRAARSRAFAAAASPLPATVVTTPTTTNGTTTITTVVTTTVEPPA